MTETDQKKQLLRNVVRKINALIFTQNCLMDNWNSVKLQVPYFCSTFNEKSISIILVPSLINR